MAPRLPLEVVERIIDDVVEYDNNLIDLSSIKTCALVCHSFLPLCRKHIFAYVTLNARHPSSPTSDDFNHLLSNSPHLAVYVRNLVYHVNRKEFVTKRFSWLLIMFKKLVKLQNLNIAYLPSAPGRKLNWMSSCERKVLLPLLHLPTLTSITLSAFRNFPLTDLASCVNLKELQIQSLECSAPNGDGKILEALPATPVMLERLAIVKGDVKLIQQLCDARRPDGKSIIDFSSLKIISAAVERVDLMTELFGMCRNLHRINLQIIIGRDPLYISTLKGLFIMLKPSLPTLVAIGISYYINNESETYDGSLTGLCHELEKMTGRNVVETIRLLVWVLPGDFDCTRWGELDDVLMGSPEGWPALREVSLLFNVTTTSRDVLVDLKALQNLPMTKLVESKRVQFDFQVTEFPVY